MPGDKHIPSYICYFKIRIAIFPSFSASQFVLKPYDVTQMLPYLMLLNATFWPRKFAPLLRKDQFLGVKNGVLKIRCFAFISQDLTDMKSVVRASLDVKFSFSPWYARVFERPTLQITKNNNGNSDLVCTLGSSQELSFDSTLWDVETQNILCKETRSWIIQSRFKTGGLLRNLDKLSALVLLSSGG